MGSREAPQSDQEEDMLGTCAGPVSLFDSIYQPRAFETIYPLDIA